MLNNWEMRWNNAAVTTRSADNTVSINQSVIAFRFWTKAFVILLHSCHGDSDKERLKKDPKLDKKKRVFLNLTVELSICFSPPLSVFRQPIYAPSLLKKKEGGKEEKKRRNGENRVRCKRAFPDRTVGSGRGCRVQAAVAASREKYQCRGYEGRHYYTVDASKQLQSGSPIRPS